MSTTQARPNPPSGTLRHIDQLPGPPGLPFLGNALQIKRERIHEQVEAWCAEYGPMLQFRVGKRRIVALADHALIAGVLRDRPESFRRGSRFDAIWREMGLPVGVLVAEGDDWRRQRRMVMAGFDPAHIRHYFPAMLRVAERLSERWRGAAARGTAIDLQSDLMRFTVDTIAGLAFGAEVDTLRGDEDVIQRHLNQILPALARRSLSPFPIWRWLRLPADRQLDRSIVQIKRAMATFIAQARQRLADDPTLRSKPSNLLEAMVSAADEGGSGIGDEQVAGNVLTMLLAGEDTTANSLSWLIEMLWRHPAALARATDEVAHATKGEDFGFEAMGRLGFLEACIHETMRLKPVVPQIAAQALRDVTVGDLAVPAGTVLYAVLRRDSVDERRVPRALVFEPERWLDGAPVDSLLALKRMSTPFGAGPRICPGRYLAMLEMKLVMSFLLSRFEIDKLDTPDGKPAAERLAITMAPVGLTMRLRAIA